MKTLVIIFTVLTIIELLSGHVKESGTRSIAKALSEYTKREVWYA